DSAKLNASNAYIHHLVDNRENKASLKVSPEDLDGVFNAVNGAVAQLQEKVIKAVTQVEERPHNVFLVGGGSYLIEPAVRKHFDKSKIIMVDNPQFALSLAIADTVFA
ncbi:TPA: stbA family protein, partial [Escherichia coli]|nr:stbA family protein [Escherichia coli]